MAEKFGGKHSLGLGIFGTAVFTLLTPIVVKYWDWQGLIAIRVLEGLGEVNICLIMSMFIDYTLLECV